MYQSVWLIICLITKWPYAASEHDYILYKEQFQIFSRECKVYHNLLLPSHNPPTVWPDFKVYLFWVFLHEKSWSAVSWFLYQRQHCAVFNRGGCSDSPGSTSIPPPAWPTFFPVLHLNLLLLLSCPSRDLFPTIVPTCRAFHLISEPQSLHSNLCYLLFIWLDLSGVLFSCSQKHLVSFATRPPEGLKAKMFMCVCLNKI